MIAYIIQFIALVALSCGFIVYYSHKTTAIYARILVFLAFLTCFVSFMILPIDIYQSAKKAQQSSSENLEYIQQSWLVIFYINFFSCWIVLPFFQQFQDSGKFTIKSKLKQAFIMNAILIGILCAGAVAIIIYLIIIEKFAFSQIPSVFAMLVNFFGLTLVSILLGFGLVSLPKQFYKKRDYKVRVKICHRSAQVLKTQQQQILQQIYEIRKVLNTQQIIRHFQANEVSHLLTFIQQNFPLSSFRSYGDNSQSLSKKSISDLHKIIKKHYLHYQSCQSQLQELVDQLKQVTMAFSSNNYKWKKILYNILFFISLIISIIVFCGQISIFTTQKISVLYWINIDIASAYFLNCALLIYIVYVVTHTIFRVKVYRVFELHKKHSTAASLLFTSINLTRISYPLCYNYLQLTSINKAQFIDFLGTVSIPTDLIYVFPIIMLLFGLFNILDLYDTILGYLGLGSYAFDEEQANQKSEEGRKILIEKLKQRNQELHQMEMIQLL